MPSQQATTESAPMEGVKRTNVVIVRGQRQGQGMEIPPRQDPYIMKVDWGRNYYTCGGLGHMTCHCRNWRQRGRGMEGRRVEYRGGRFEGNIK